MSSIVKIRPAAAAQALLWEFCRRGWWRILNAQMAILGVSVIVYSSLLRSGPLDPEAGRTLHFVLLWILFVASGGAALAAQGEAARLYRLPLSNRVLATVTMFPGLVCVAATFAITAGLLNGLYGVGWPILGPSLFLAAALGAIQSATRVAGPRRLTQFVVWCFVAILFEHWLRGRYGGGSFLLPKTMWTTVTFSEWLTMGSVIGVEFLITAQGIARERRGDRALLSMIPTRAVLRGRKAGRELPRFRSAGAAQFWFEWKQKGLILPGTFAAFAIFMIMGYLLNRFDNGEYELLHACMGYGVGLGPIAIVAGLVLGHVDLPQANAECGSWLATRPMTATALSAALLEVEAASLLITWGLWVAGMIAATGLLYFHQGSEPVLDLWTDHGKFAHELATLGYWYPVLLIGICLIAAWIPLALATALVLTGRQRLLVAFVSGCIPALLFGLYLASARAEGRVIVPDGIWKFLIGGTAGFATVFGFATARRRGLIGWPTCGAALAGWLALCGLAGSVSFLVGSLNSTSQVLTAGVLALPLAPLAIGPLALSWNRHR
jgi:hypothetical protein